MNIEKLVLDLCSLFHYKAQAYFVWGVNDETHEIVGTTFNQYGDYNKEPYRVVVLVIPAAEELPTAFKEKRYIRIGSSKANSHFPLRVSIFEGETKGSNLFSVREFGNNCLLYTLDEVLRYADVLNYKCSFA